ncbi:putative cytidylate kinase [Paucilactobacillus hokkaidonensis JCM 18461]|uniref:Putative cytidylate kinase n=1 Tax=Paucilactobacillus hokkaidonensis JCM 18461 TaxID=1291742 RepID=A0A0A1GWK1_9LACO|nr:putative cytidylate kinase [Paucilactobacillus hokkaidonensis JCM 18461]
MPKSDVATELELLLTSETELTMLVPVVALELFATSVSLLLALVILLDDELSTVPTPEFSEELLLKVTALDDEIVLSAETVLAEVWEPSLTSALTLVATVKLIPNANTANAVDDQLKPFFTSLKLCSSSS